MDPLLQSIGNRNITDRVASFVCEACLIEYGFILLRPTKERNEFQFKYFVYNFYIRLIIFHS